MDALIDDADHLRVPVATSTPVPDAVVHLERFDFAVASEASSSATGPHRWTMARPVADRVGLPRRHWFPRARC
jgi:hypothetical protein